MGLSHVCLILTNALDECRCCIIVRDPRLYSAAFYMLTHLHEHYRNVRTRVARILNCNMHTHATVQVLARSVKRRKTLPRTVIYEFVEFEFAALYHRVKCFAREFTGDARARSGVMIADGH